MMIVVLLLISISSILLFMLQSYIFRQRGRKTLKQQFNKNSVSRKNYYWRSVINLLRDTILGNEKESHIRYDHSSEGWISYWVPFVIHYVYTSIVYFKIQFYYPLCSVLHLCIPYTYSITPFRRFHHHHRNLLSESYSSYNEDDDNISNSEASPSPRTTFFKRTDTPNAFGRRNELPQLEYIGDSTIEEDTLASYYPEYAFRHLQKLETNWDINTIEPRFLKEEEYPCNWLTYDPIQDCVVTRKRGDTHTTEEYEQPLCITSNPMG